MMNRVLFSVRPGPLAAALLALLLAACAATGDRTSPTSTPTADAPASEPSDSAPEDDSMPMAGTSGEALAQLVAAAADVAGVDIGEVRVVTAEEVTWPDGSIGCPEPGMMYTQALVAGYRVVLEIDGEELHFHAAQGGKFFLCENPRPPGGAR